MRARRFLCQSDRRAPLPDGDYAGDQPSSDDDEGLDVTELRKQFTDYVTIKQSEILEARTALKYYHGDQWTKEQLDTLQARGQPAITFNRVGRKIDGLVGVLEKLRGDPKAVGRVENDEQGAELSTQCIRYALDLSRFAAQETEALRKGACTGHRDRRARHRAGRQARPGHRCRRPSMRRPSSTIRAR